MGIGIDIKPDLEISINLLLVNITIKIGMNLVVSEVANQKVKVIVVDGTGVDYNFSHVKIHSKSVNYKKQKEVAYWIEGKVDEHKV